MVRNYPTLKAEDFTLRPLYSGWLNDGKLKTYRKGFASCCLGPAWTSPRGFSHLSSSPHCWLFHRFLGKALAQSLGHDFRWHPSSIDLPLVFKGFPIVREVPHAHKSHIEGLEIHLLLENSVDVVLIGFKDYEGRDIIGL